MEIRAERLRDALDDGKIVLVAGFQGVSEHDRNVTTLGRGGSDTTAVALAAALGADVCEIYTDVTGVFTADPRVEPDARKLPLVSHEEMLEMAATGSKVLALRSVEFARRHDVPLHVRSSFLPEEGTWITKETPDMEKAIVSGIAHRSDEAKITVSGVRQPPRRRRADLRPRSPTEPQRGHDHPERRRRPTGRRHVHRPARRAAPAPSRRSRAIARRAGLPRAVEQRPDRQGHAGRRRHEVASPASPPRCSACSGRRRASTSR